MGKLSNPYIKLQDAPKIATSGDMFFVWVLEFTLGLLKDNFPDVAVLTGT